MRAIHARAAEGARRCTEQIEAGMGNSGLFSEGGTGAAAPGLGGKMPIALHPCALAPLLRELRLSAGQLAAVLGVSRRTLHRYLARGAAPAPVATLAAQLAAHGIPPELRDRVKTTPRAHSVERARLVRIAQAYAASMFIDQARDAYVAAGFTVAQANAHLARQLEQQQRAQLAAAAARNALRRQQHAAYMRAQRAMGKYREPTTRAARAAHRAASARRRWH
jgi:hypothetical protein